MLTLGRTANPSLEWKKAGVFKITGDDDDSSYFSMHRNVDSITDTCDFVVQKDFQQTS